MTLKKSSIAQLINYACKDYSFDYSVTGMINQFNLEPLEDCCNKHVLQDVQ